MINVGSDFSGVGALDQALLAMNIPYKKQFVCDYNEYARQSYVINYGTAADKELVFSKEHKKIAKQVTGIIENDPKFSHLIPEEVFAQAEIIARKFSFYYPFNVYNREIPETSLDLYVTSPPCQGFSMAGKREGSILFFNSLEFITKNKPRYFIFENVKGLLSHEKDKKNKKALYGKTFSEWINYLAGKSVNGNPSFFAYEDSVPYHIYFKVINAKDHEVPQNIERVFIIGIRDDEDHNFSFPKPTPLTKRLKDVLEKEVDEKYYLSDTMLEYFNKRADNFNNGTINYKEENDIASTITSSSSSLDISDNIIKEGFINQDTQASQVFSPDGVSPNVCAGSNGYANGYILDKDTPKLNQVGSLYENNSDAGRIYDSNGIAATIKAEGGGLGAKTGLYAVENETAKCIVYNVVDKVKVRKYNVDVVGLKNLLRKHKKSHSIKSIAEKLGLEKTKVEHYFRTDNHFAIPDPEYWFKLKEILSIKENDFDVSIIEFIEKDNVFEKSNRVYSEDGISPTLTTLSEEKILVQNEPKIMSYTRDEKGKVTSRHENDVANTITTSTGGGGSTDQFVKEQTIGDLRGRNLENPSRHDKGIPLEQTLERSENEISNTLTSVYKDNVVLVPSANKEGFEIAEADKDSISLAHKKSSTARGKVGVGVAQTIDTTNNQGILTKDKRLNKTINSHQFKEGEPMHIDSFNNSVSDIASTVKPPHNDRFIFNGYRIRKLTPTECFRLMDFDESFMNNIKKHNDENPKQAISDSQLYKQAGNSIVRKMFIILLQKLNIK